MVASVVRRSRRLAIGLSKISDEKKVCTVLQKTRAMHCP